MSEYRDLLKDEATGLFDNMNKLLAQTVMELPEPWTSVMVEHDPYETIGEVILYGDHGRMDWPDELVDQKEVIEFAATLMQTVWYYTIRDEPDRDKRMADCFPRQWKVKR
jgi:hypothetical protein